MLRQPCEGPATRDRVHPVPTRSRQLTVVRWATARTNEAMHVPLYSASFVFQADLRFTLSVGLNATWCPVLLWYSLPCRVQIDGLRSVERLGVSVRSGFGET